MYSKLAAVALVCGLLISCAPKASTPAPPTTPLQKAAIAEADIAAVIGQIQTALINGNAQGVIPDAVVSSVLSVTVKVAQADQQATNITKGLSALTPDQQKNIAAIFAPIAAAVSDSINTGLVPIKNANTQATVRALLVTLQSTIAGLQIALGGN